MKSLIAMLLAIIFLMPLTAMAGTKAEPADSKTVSQSPVFHYGQPERGHIDLTLQKTATFTDIGHEDEYYFKVGLKDAAVDSQGRVYLLDFDKILMFDATGRFIRQIGRAGQGPGEYVQPAGIWIDDRDQLVVNDSARLMVHRYDSDLQPTADIRLPTFITSKRILTDHQGRMYALKGMSPRFELIQLSPKGKEIKEWARYPRHDIHQTGKLMGVHTYSLSPQLFTTISKGDLVIHNDPYEYKLFLNDADGQLIGTIILDVPKQAVSSAEKDWVLEHIGKPPKIYIPDSRPPIAGILADDRGLIFVLRNPPLMDVIAKKPWQADVFDRSGHYLARVTLPFETRLIRHGCLYLVYNGEDEIRAETMKILNYDRLIKP